MTDTSVRLPGSPYRSEQAFQAAVIDLAEKTGWLVHYETLPFRSRAGWPDLVLVKPARGLKLALELKVNAPLTAAQAGWLNALTRCGIPAYCVRPADLPWLELVLTGQKRPEEGPKT